VTPSPSESPLQELPPPGEINRRIGILSRELTLLRRLLRLSVAAHHEIKGAHTDPLRQGEVSA
jgi:hypothetical protein